MTVTLSSDIAVAQEHLTLSSPIAASLGDLFRLEDEMVEFIGYQMPLPQPPKLGYQPPIAVDLSKVRLRRGVSGTVTVQHAAGTELLGVAIGHATAADSTKPDPFMDEGGGSALTVKDEGSTLDTAVTSLDFTGAGVTATAVGHDVTVDVPGTTLYSAAFPPSGVIGQDALVFWLDTTKTPPDDTVRTWAETGLWQNAGTVDLPIWSQDAVALGYVDQVIGGVWPEDGVTGAGLGLSVGAIYVASDSGGQCFSLSDADLLTWVAAPPGPLALTTSAGAPTILDGTEPEGSHYVDTNALVVYEKFDGDWLIPGRGPGFGKFTASGYTGLPTFFATTSEHWYDGIWFVMPEATLGSWVSGFGDPGDDTPRGVQVGDTLLQFEAMGGNLRIEGSTAISIGPLVASYFGLIADTPTGAQLTLQTKAGQTAPPLNIINSDNPGKKLMTINPDGSITLYSPADANPVTLDHDSLAALLALI